MAKPKEDRLLEIFQQDPLLAFSLYTQIQVKFLEQTSIRIETVLDDGIDGTHIQGGCFNEAYGLFWLWVLGSYEVVRTMSQHAECFDTDLKSRIVSIKRYLKRLRIPFAKQELPRWDRKKEIQPIWGELSVTDIDTENKDLRFRIEGHDLTARSALKEFREFIASIELASIKGKIPTAPSPYA